MLLARPAQEIRYEVRCDAKWRTREARVRAATRAGVREMRLTVGAGGRWRLGGREIAALRGCVDVDLSFTPATNTLPIRRLRPRRGATVDVETAWVLVRGWRVVRARQSYTRLAARRWRYRSQTFAADLTVDAAGLVVRYGGLWERA